MIGHRRPRRPKTRKARPRTRGNAEKRLVSFSGALGLLAFAAFFVAGIVLTQWPRADFSNFVLAQTLGQQAVQAATHQRETSKTGDGAELATLVNARFEQCGLRRETCVVDGDTFWLNGVKIRVADIDTPEIHRPRCTGERVLGERATRRLIELLNDGPFKLIPAGDRDEDRYGRKLRVVARDTESLGQRLVDEGLARNWTGKREPWCPRI